MSHIVFGSLALKGWLKIFLFGFLTVLFSFCKVLDGTLIDVNPQELQYVADHLTDHKCSQLIEALYQRTFQLQHSHTPKGHNSTQQLHRKPCTSKLTAWSDGPGRNQTVEYLSLRLTEIGLPKLSKKVSGFVLKETSEELHRYFLDDPFKDMIPTKSLMVDEEDDDQEETKDQLLDERGRGKEDKEDRLFIAVIIIATIALSLFTTISVCLLCPKAGQYVCQHGCPRLCASCYDVLVDGCHSVWYRTKNNINNYMLVTPKGAGSGGALAV